MTTDTLCPVCGSPMFHRRAITGEIVIHSSCLTCSNRDRLAASERNRAEAKRRFLNNMSAYLIRRDFPKRQLLSVLDVEASQSAKERAACQRLPAFIGEAGTGKTWLAVQLAVVIASQVEPVEENFESGRFKVYDDHLPLFLCAPDLAVRLRSTFGRSGGGITEQSLLEHYSRADILLIDDLGAESTSEYTLAMLYALVNHRYSRDLRTIITSNLRLQDLARRIGDRCVSRICELCEVVEVRGEDLRLKARRMPLGPDKPNGGRATP